MTETRKSFRWRLLVLIGLFTTIIFALGARLFQLTVLDRQHLMSESAMRVNRDMTIPVTRGRILDRHGKLLATSLPVPSVWVDPSQQQLTDADISCIAAAISTDEDKLRQRLQSDHQFLYIKRFLSADEAKNIERCHSPSLHYLTEYKRFYPEAEAVSQLIGTTTVEGQGISGIEKMYQDKLQGQSGKIKAYVDRHGHMLATSYTTRQPVPGEDITLSIDQRLQYTAYQALNDANDRYHFDHASVIMMDVHSGEVLVLANAPSFDPHHITKEQVPFMRNYAITDLYEPGSTIKPLAMMAALQSGDFNEDSIIDVHGGKWQVGGHTIADEHPRDTMTLTEILAKSSNVGMSKIVMALPEQAMFDVLQDVGLGQAQLPPHSGERVGHVPKQYSGKPIELATLSFGYGLTVTALQLTSAYAALATGIVPQVSLIKKHQGQKIEQVESIWAADKHRQLLNMLRQVLAKGGTATVASVDGIDAAGKTGTASVFEEGEYSKQHYIASFYAILPVENPQFVIAVVVDHPHSYLHYGGLIAGPIYVKLVKHAHSLGIV